MVHRLRARLALVTLIAIASGAGSLATATPASAAAGEFGPWLYWNSPSGTTFSALSQRVTPRNLAPTMYWSTQWFWNGAPNGGYAGIQTDGQRADDSTGPMAIFSIWDATKAHPGPDAACIPFDGEGVGRSCRIPFPVVAGHTYRTDIVTTRVDVDGRWWHATVVDETANSVADLGEIAAPANATLAMPSSFVEYFGPAVGCDQYPIVVSDFDAPVVTPVGTTTPAAGTFMRATNRTCERALISAGASTATLTFGGPQPSLVPNAQVTSAENVATVTWDTAISAGDSPISGYAVQGSRDRGTTWLPVATTAADGRAATFTVAGGTWVFRVAAVSAAGTGAWSVGTDPRFIDRAPEVALTAPAAAVQTQPTFTVAWSATDPDGVASYTVQRTDTEPDHKPGPWRTLLTKTTNTTTQFAGTYGHTYCFRVSAADALGFTSPFTPPRCTTVPLRANQLTYSTGWTRINQSALYAGMSYTTATKGATANRTALMATRIYLIASRCPGCGTVEVRWNGTPVGTVGLTASITKHREVIAVTTFTAVRTGTMSVVVTSPNGRMVQLEGFAVAQ